MALQYWFVFKEGGTAEVTRRSAISGKLHTRTLQMTEEQKQRWERGELIQHVFPNLSRDDREFLVSGSTPEEWKEAFGESPTVVRCPPQEKEY